MGPQVKFGPCSGLYFRVRAQNVGTFTTQSQRMPKNVLLFQKNCKNREMVSCDWIMNIGVIKDVLVAQLISLNAL